jgi:hypothetical protein
MAFLVHLLFGFSVLEMKHIAFVIYGLPYSIIGVVVEKGEAVQEV